MVIITFRIMLSNVDFSRTLHQMLHMVAELGRCGCIE